MSTGYVDFLDYINSHVAASLSTRNTIDIEALIDTYLKTYNPTMYGLENKWVMPLILYHTHVTTISDGIRKDISISDFKGLLDSVSNSVTAINPMSLPYGCFMYSRSGDLIHLNCYYPGTIAKVTHNRKTYSIPLPNIIIYYSLKTVGKDLWQIQEVKYFITNKKVSQLPDNKLITAKDSASGIYNLPFSNMYEDCRMCYGSNTMPSRFTNNLRGLDYYYQIITIAPFNDDLGIRGLNSSYTPTSWFQHLSTLTEFPYELMSNR